jgi:tetratricopeptide (TPR) repeat protein
MKIKGLFGLMLAGMLACACGSTAVSTTSSSQAQTQSAQPQPQRKPASPQSSTTFKADFAFVQPEVDAAKYAPAQALLQTMEQNPSALSKNEYYAASKAYEPGSAGFNKVYETAVKYFPNDEMVNLNRANARMQANDTVGAKAFLDKAGESAAAVYSRGVWYALRGSLQQALAYFNKAEEMGYPKAAAAVRALVGSK